MTESAEPAGQVGDGSVQPAVTRPARPAIRPITTHAEPVQQPESPTDSATISTHTSPTKEASASAPPSSARLSPLESFLQAAGKV